MRCVLRIRPSLLFFHTIEDFVDIHGFVDFHVGSGAELSDGQPLFPGDSEMD